MRQCSYLTQTLPRRMPVSIAKCRSFANGESRNGGRNQRTTSMRWSSKHRSMILAPSSPRQQDENVISELQKLPREELIRKLVQEQDRRMLAQVSLASMGALAPPGIDSPHAACNTSPLFPGAPLRAKCPVIAGICIILLISTPFLRDESTHC